jgi:hypothetical protein
MPVTRDIPVPHPKDKALFEKIDAVLAAYEDSRETD